MMVELLFIMIKQMERLLISDLPDIGFMEMNSGI